MEIEQAEHSIYYIYGPHQLYEGPHGTLTCFVVGRVDARYRLQPQTLACTDLRPHLVGCISLLTVEEKLGRQTASPTTWSQTNGGCSREVAFASTEFQVRSTTIGHGNETVDLACGSGVAGTKPFSKRATGAEETFTSRSIRVYMQAAFGSLFRPAGSIEGAFSIFFSRIRPFSELLADLYLILKRLRIQLLELEDAAFCWRLR